MYSTCSDIPYPKIPFIETFCPKKLNVIHTSVNVDESSRTHSLGRLAMTMQTTSSVSERALRLLEIIAKADEPPTLNELMSAIQLPKATTHRFVSLLEEIGETCNITMIDGDRLIYLDRVESDWPLQFRLKIGSHVPLHCTASGKIFLAFSSPSLRKALFRKQPLPRHTPRTLTVAAEIEHAL